jgi:shikimate kinase
VDKASAGRDESPVIDQNWQALTERCNMRIFLAGVSCVGKTAIGARLAELLRMRFFDLDVETERFYGMSIERLQNRHLTSHGFRLAVSRALQHVLSLEESCHCVIALPPSGLLSALWKVIGKTRDATTVVLSDTPENILRRITFYDIESRLLQVKLTDHEQGLYLREIKRDIAYYKCSFRRANVTVDISSCGLEEASRKVWDVLKSIPSNDRDDAPEPCTAMMHARG